jgi:DNA-binding FadR family transcriptional regulator
MARDDDYEVVEGRIGVLDLAEVRPPSLASRRTAAQGTNRGRVAYRVARDMASWLLEAELPEGARLPPEQDLCLKMGCSRSGIRSALRLLENWGLITIQAGRDGGPVVRRPRVSDLKDTLSILIHSQHATLEDVLLARRAIDPIIAAEAAVNATDDQIQRLDDALERIRRPDGTQRDFLGATAEFDAVLADASQLVILGLVLRILSSFGEESIIRRSPLDDEWRQHVLGILERIRNAVAARDGERARAEMTIARRESEQHWQQRGQDLLRLPLGPFEFGL